MLASNPLAQTFAAIWTLLEANEEFVNLVPSACRIKYDGEQVYQDLDQQTEGEPIRVSVMCAGIDPHLQNTSSGSAMDLLWEIEIRTVDQGMLNLFKVLFAVYRAMLKWDTYMRDDLKWNDEYFCWDATPGKVKVQLGDKDQEIRGWIAKWIGVARMEFQTSALEEDE